MSLDPRCTAIPFLTYLALVWILERSLFLSLSLQTLSSIWSYSLSPCCCFFNSSSGSTRYCKHPWTHFTSLSAWSLLSGEVQHCIWSQVCRGCKSRSDQLRARDCISFSNRLQEELIHCVSHKLFNTCKLWLKKHLLSYLRAIGVFWTEVEMKYLGLFE